MDPVPGDRAVVDAVVDTAGTRFDTPARVVGYTATAWVLVPVAIGIAVWAIARRAWSALAVVVGVAVLVWAVNPLLKRAFARDRPPARELVEPTSRWSFPAGHAVASAGFAAVVVLLAWRTRARRPVVGAAVVYVLVVGASRLVLGVHHPTDLLAGWAAAVAVVAGLAALTLARPPRRASDSAS